MSCKCDGTQPLDTGQQLAASNVSFDDTLINSGCPHVQCVLETMGKRQIDHIADRGNPHEVNISQVPHSLEDHSNVFIPATVDGEVLTVQAGVWGSSAPVTGTTDHLLLTNIGTNSHEIIDEHIANITLNPHMITAAMTGAEPANANIQAHIVDLITNPHAVGYDNLVGTPPANENILINGDFRVNQRQFDGNWAGLADGEFGYDRWVHITGATPDEIHQRIEAENLISSNTYTLSWEGGGEGALWRDSSPVATPSVSPWTGPIGSADPAFAWSVRLPDTATNIKLELGTAATPFQPRNIQQELAMCQRFYEIGDSGSPTLWTGYIVNVGSAFSGAAIYKVEKRVNPTVTLSHLSSNGFPTSPGTLTAQTALGFIEQRVSDAQKNGGWFRSTWIADAEIT